MDKTIADTKKERIARKVEEMGVFFEQSGGPPLRARVLAYLLLAEPPQKDFFEIQEFLKASKSATSNALNDLMKENVVDYVTFLGDRKRYFRVNTKGWLDTIKMRVQQASTMRHLLEGILQERADSQYPEFSEELVKISDFINFIMEEIDRGISRWEQLSNKK